MGGAWFQEVFGNPDEVTEQLLLDRATQAVTSHLGVTTPPIWSIVALLKVRRVSELFHMSSFVFQET